MGGREREGMKRNIVWTLEIGMWTWTWRPLGIELEYVCHVMVNGHELDKEIAKVSVQRNEYPHER